MSSIVRLAVSLVCITSFLAPVAASAYMITTPYWCGSYYSSVPCGGYNYVSSGAYNNYWPYYPSNSYINYQYYPNYTYVYPEPTCTITASVSNNYSYYSGYSLYAQAGNYAQTVTLSWVGNNATSAYLSPQGSSVPTSGSMTVYAYGSATYTLTVSGPGGTRSCQTSYSRPNYQQTYYQPQYYQYSYSNYQYPYWW